MKTNILTLFLALICVAGFSQTQEMNYEVRGKYTNPIKKEKLSTAQVMGDIIPSSPVQWIMSYVSTEIKATVNGKIVKAIGSNNVLTNEQKDLLNKADLGTDIIVKIDYTSKNAVTDAIEKSQVNYRTTFVPETDAKYEGGYAQMREYLEENAITKIPEVDVKRFAGIVVRFTVNEEGGIANAQIARTSGNAETDKLLLDTINKMPKWTPAKNADGVTVKQEFEFSVGNVGGGC